MKSNEVNYVQEEAPSDNINYTITTNGPLISWMDNNTGGSYELHGQTWGTPTVDIAHLQARVEQLEGTIKLLEDKISLQEDVINRMNSFLDEMSKAKGEKYKLKFS